LVCVRERKKEGVCETQRVTERVREKEREREREKRKGEREREKKRESERERETSGGRESVQQMLLGIGRLQHTLQHNRYC